MRGWARGPGRQRCTKRASSSVAPPWFRIGGFYQLATAFFSKSYKTPTSGLLTSQIFSSLDEHWVARLGALRRGTALPSPYEQLRHIMRIILHPDYVDAGFINDISLLQMESPVIFSDYVRPICLPPANSTLRDSRMCTVIGWGQLFEVGRIFRK